MVLSTFNARNETRGFGRHCDHSLTTLTIDDLFWASARLLHICGDRGIFYILILKCVYCPSVCPPLYLPNHWADFKSKHGFGTLSSRKERKITLTKNRKIEVPVDETEGRDTYVGCRPSESKALTTRAEGAVGTRSASCL